ncbi:MAG: ABC transporter permease [Clostridium sp.]|uniref:ABC transporter permease n=1 Tax=Clostridium sp. DSM 8431 TaxID=1761781 RepID=UPI0008EF8DE2|nr:ABC transporter permease [Clostridium sp. DSM 8431]MCR4943332.1 ABC transporter permease [Clostridium sp.]SFU33768.1 spermidine/putrescine transport system permease protein [Clostridium sp. DSM 8431]
MNKKRSITSYPYILWSGLFIVIPLLIVLFFSFTEIDNNSYVFSLNNYTRLFRSQYVKIFYRSIKLALISTVGCLILGYPIAYIISKMKESRRNLLIMLFILPMWMNFLLRTYAWMPILGKTGIVNNLLSHFGIGPIGFLYNDGAVLLGMIYNFLPFMVLPIYTVLNKMDESYIQAAEDLGADTVYIFRKIIFPLSLPGVMSGITMVFMPAVSTFVISSLLGGGQYMLLGNLIEQEFTTMGNRNLGSAIAVVMMIVILISMSIMNRFSDSNDEGSEGLW